MEAAVRALQMPHAKSDVMPVVTLSLGVAVTISGRGDVPGLLSLADEQLYKAKAQGRGRVCGAGEGNRTPV